MVKDSASQHYRGLRGFINEGQSTGYWVELPNGAPAKTFPVAQLIELPQNASLRDRLTASVRVWIYRSRGLPVWAQDYLRAQRGHKALVRCLGYNALYKKFLFTTMRGETQAMVESTPHIPRSSSDLGTARSMFRVAP